MSTTSPQVEDLRGGIRSYGVLASIVGIVAGPELVEGMVEWLMGLMVFLVDSGIVTREEVSELLAELATETEMEEAPRNGNGEVLMTGRDVLAADARKRLEI